MSEYRIAAPGAVLAPRRCLSGVRILLIDGCEATAETLRRFAAESGARLRRADRVAAAHRHLAICRPDVIVVDLDLPEGGGLVLIRALATALGRSGAIVATSARARGSWESRARSAGAAACLQKPVTNLRAFQTCMLGFVPNRGVRAVVVEQRRDGRRHAKLTAS